MTVSGVNYTVNFRYATLSQSILENIKSSVNEMVSIAMLIKNEEVQRGTERCTCHQILEIIVPDNGHLSGSVTVMNVLMMTLVSV